MTKPLSDRVQRIQPSPTLAVAARAEELKAAGKDIISLSVGEPDFDTPDYIKEAAIKAIKDGMTKYTAVDGIPSLRKAICNKLARDNQLQYKLNQILVSCGGKHSIFNLFEAVLNAGDEVIIPAPYWVSYPDQVKLADATPVIVQTSIEQRFKILPEQLEAAITPKTRLFVINTPSNPTGIAYSRKELAALGQVLIKHPDIIVMSDDLYELNIWTAEPFSNILMACPELYNQCVIVDGVSKSYAMTGWRIGYAAGPEKIIAAMKKIQSQSTSNATSIAQIAAEAALNGDQSSIAKMTRAYKERHDFVYAELQKMPGIQCLPADGTFYIFPRVEDLIKKGKLNDDIALADYLLNEANLAVIPGSAFGTPGYMRLSYATSMENLREAMQRMRAAFGKL